MSCLVLLVCAVKFVTLRMAWVWSNRYLQQFADEADVKVVVNDCAVETFAGGIAIVVYMFIGACMATSAIYFLYQTREEGLHPDMLSAWIYFAPGIAVFLTLGGLHLRHSYLIWKGSLLEANKHLQRLSQK